MARAEGCTDEPGATAPVDPHTASSLRKLAHELNSLLDGSLRCLGLAEHAIDAGGPVAGEVQSRLRAARDAMRDMAHLLEEAMNNPESRFSQLVRSDRPLETELRLALERLRPYAEEHHVHLHAQMDPEAGSTPAGPLSALVHNVVRNAIEACGREGADQRVELSIDLLPGNRLRIIVLDTGPGLPVEVMAGLAPPHGHGIGLETCREIVADLGGWCRLTNVPFGHGALFEAHIPVQQLS